MTRAGKIVLMTGLMVLVGFTAIVDGRGGRGGGGGFRGGGGGGRPAGGGGMSRPRPGGSAPSFSRPPTGMNRAARPATRPAGGTRPSISAGARPATRPSTGVRPNPGLQPGSRPNLGAGGSRPGNRPATGLQPGTRPSQLPAGRPGGITRPGTGLGQPGIANRPAAGQGIGRRPGASQLPAALPGLGDRLPNHGAGLADRAANRPQTLEARQGDLQDRMTNGREDWQSHRQDMQGDRQDWRDQHREDWQSWADGHINDHGDWYHDSWHGDWYPGSGWSYMWDNYPVAAAFGVTRWGINRLAYGFGYWNYSNPYAEGGGSYGYDYSEPLVSYADTGTAAQAEPAPADPVPADVAEPGRQEFADARVAFYSGNYAEALTLLDTTLKSMPNDTVVHEFRGLVLFALKKYPESAAATYAVLSAGPGWDWTTLSSLYPSVGTYSQQLRALEQFVKMNPRSADAAFLLGYHYLTMGKPENASNQFKVAQSLLPTDRLIAQLVEMTTPPAKSAAPSAAPSEDAPPKINPVEAPAVPLENQLKMEMVVGNWQAISRGAVFKLSLSEDGAFTWGFERGKDKQTVKGVFALDQNTLAMEPEAGGTMLAEVEKDAAGMLRFKMIGGDADDSGLLFKKN